MAGGKKQMIDIDGNLYALRQYEAEQDRLQRLDEELMRIEEEIWEQDALLVEAIRAADSIKSIEAAVEAYAITLLEHRR
jgi:hypothetical protein